MLTTTETSNNLTTFSIEIELPTAAVRDEILAVPITIYNPKSDQCDFGIILENFMRQFDFADDSGKKNYFQKYF